MTQFVVLIVTLFAIQFTQPHANAATRSCKYADYLKLAQLVIQGADGNDQQMIKAIAGAFADAHLQEPSILLWPGMASLAQSKFITAIAESPLLSEATKQNAILTTQEVFWSGYVPLMIFLMKGYPELQRLADRHDGINQETASAFQSLANGGTSNVLNGNALLLAREHEVLQEHFYSKDIGLLGPASSLFACANFSNSALGVQCFSASYPFSSFKNLKKRTAWNVDVLLPSFEEFHELRSNDLKKIQQQGAEAGGRYPDFSGQSGQSCN